jgi:hypothetical protein
MQDISTVFCGYQAQSVFRNLIVIELRIPSLDVPPSLEASSGEASPLLVAVASREGDPRATRSTGLFLQVFSTHSHTSVVLETMKINIDDSELIAIAEGEQE